MTHEKIYPQLRKWGSSHVITISPKVITCLGLKDGDRLKVWISKDIPDEIIESDKGLVEVKEEDAKRG